MNGIGILQWICTHSFYKIFYIHAESSHELEIRAKIIEWNTVHIIATIKLKN